MNREEEKIRYLFRELREDDECNAPSFSRDWSAALSKIGTLQPRWHFWQRSVGVASLLILLGAVGWLSFRQSILQITPSKVVRSDLSDPHTVSRVSPLAVSEIAPRISRSRFRAKDSHKTNGWLPSIRRKASPILISQWRSPTESLLQTPGDRLLKEMPRLDESVVNLNATILKQTN